MTSSSSHASASANKAVVRRFNDDFIVKGDQGAFQQLMAPGFVNHSSPPGYPKGAESISGFIDGMLRPAVKGLSVDIHEQVAEGDKVVTRKTIRGTHSGDLMGAPATNKPISISVIDIFTVRNGQLVDHYALSSMAEELTKLQQ